MKRLFLMAGVIFLVQWVVSCSEQRNVMLEPPPPPDYLTYTANMKPLFDGACVSCHGETNPSGTYSMATYAALLENGSDGTTPNAIAGDSTCLLITKIKDGHFAWNGDEDKIRLLVQWVYTDSLREN